VPAPQHPLQNQLIAEVPGVGAQFYAANLWLNTFEQGRLFVIRGFSEVVAHLGITKSEHLNRGIAASSRSKEQPEKYRTRMNAYLNHINSGEWDDFAPKQLGRAIRGEGQSLIKTYQSIFALEHFAELRPSGDFDIYNHLEIVPACYRPAEFSEDVVRMGGAAAADAFAALVAQGAAGPGEEFVLAGKAQHVLNHVAKGGHATRRISQYITNAYADAGVNLDVVQAVRPGNANVKAAADFIRFPPLPLAMPALPDLAIAENDANV
jgi:hypothetical protein